MIVTLQSIFVDKLVRDDRMPKVLGSMLGYQISLVPGHLIFQPQIVTLICIQVLISNVFAVAAWYGVVVPRSKVISLPIAALLFGLALYVPFGLIELLDLRSRVLRFGSILVPMVIPLKLLNTVVGVDSPSRRSHLRSFSNYFYYMGFVLRPRKSSSNGAIEPFSFRRFTQRHLLGFATWFCLTMLALNVLVPVNFSPLAAEPPPTLLPTFQIANLYNTYAQAVSLLLTLTFSLYGTAGIVSVMGNFAVSDELFDSPFSATSPTDFWSNRWNSLVHVGLKEGIYKPSRSLGASKTVATLLTFGVSGLLHEYVSMVIFYRNSGEQLLGDQCTTCYDSVFGKHLIFFGWNGVLMAMEHSHVGNMVRGAVPKLPRLLHSHLVILLALPIAHLFTQDLVDSGYFHHLNLAFPNVRISKVD